MLVILKKQILLFVLVGGIGLFVDLLLTWVFSFLFNIYLSRVFAFLMAAFTTWILNRYFTFEIDVPINKASKFSAKFVEYIRYLFSTTIGFCINFSVFTYYISNYNNEIDIFIGVILGSITGLLFNFSILKYVVYKKIN
jgi:putative flippase GtrA